MGALCTTDVNPDLPKLILADPDEKTPVGIQVAPYGFLAGSVDSRDFGIWLNKRPASVKEQRETAWLWFNKSDGEGGQERVDLENFQRGHNKDDLSKGKVLYYALISDKNAFQYFHRIANSGTEAFTGFTEAGNSPEHNDSFYTQHPTHTPKLVRECGSMVSGEIISKWKMSNKVTFHDGELGRAANVLKGHPLEMEVFARGTAVRSYQQFDEEAADTTIFVDRIEYRLLFQGQQWALFSAPGDTDTRQNPTVDCELFTTVVVGGWAKRSVFGTVTKAGVDPALAMLIAHICVTDFGVEGVQRGLNLNIPERFPDAEGGEVLQKTAAGVALQHEYAQSTGRFQWPADAADNRV